MTQSPNLWNDPDRAKVVSKEKSDTEKLVNSFNSISQQVGDIETALELYNSEKDEEFLKEAIATVEKLESELHALEFSSKMRGEYDNSDSILEINSGAGGTEAQDWVAMIYRMYLRWAERKGFSVEELDSQPGEGAGYKSVIALVKGPYCYGHLRPEQGVHRLVRISPFDSNARRHTSFASVSVTPDIEEDVDVVIDEADLRIDTYRSSGAGGQHVNKTDSAVRLTHIPTGIVVACQNERSQHKNKDRAMKLLKAKLIERERQIQADKMAEIKGERKKIEFGSQIRSYVLHPYQMVKDLRTEYETSQAQSVLDGDLDPFIEAYLMKTE
jgi:peptide chain release factor 2